MEYLQRYNHSDPGADSGYCADPTFSCSFPMAGGGNWLFTSQTGFDPASQGIPTVPAGVQIGNYTTVGRARFGGIQVGCGGTHAAAYHCNPQDQQDELHGILGQANGHDVQPPNDCAPPSTLASGTATSTARSNTSANSSTGTGTGTSAICATSTPL